MAHATDGHHIKLLYVEDDSCTMKQVSRLLETFGYNCITAENGRQGLDLYRQHTPDIVLTDIMMPDMNGLEMAREIRADYPEAQFIFMTAFGETNYLLEAIDIGVSQFIGKPVEFQKLLAAITHCSNTARLRAEAQRARHLESVSILAGGMAHDFNNLLQVILGYISLAKMGVPADSKTFEYLSMAEKGSDQARELGQRLLYIANNNDSKRPKNPLVPLIRVVVCSALNDTDVTAEFEFPPVLPDVYFNETQMQQVIGHLVENAREAMPKGGTLHVSAYSQQIANDDGIMLPPGEYLHITFRDSGKGIPEAMLTKIFDPYHSSKEMGNRKGQGLGLTVCYSIILRHGGAIFAESREDKGTSIHILLPAAKSD